MRQKRAEKLRSAGACGKKDQFANKRSQTPMENAINLPTSYVLGEQHPKPPGYAANNAPLKFLCVHMHKPVHGRANKA